VSLYSGPFLESSLLPWQGYTVSVIRSVLFSIECFFITSKESTATSASSSPAGTLDGKVYLNLNALGISVELFGFMSH
jgi:hypothetical protein